MTGREEEEVLQKKSCIDGPLIFTLMVMDAEMAFGGLTVSFYPSYTELLDV